LQRIFHVTPFEIGRYTFGQLNAMVDTLEETRRPAKNGRTPKAMAGGSG
jgi:hypothetical protein